MPEGGKLLIKADNFTAESNTKMLSKGEYIRIIFKDSGSGIKKEILSKIFDPFFSTKMHGRGMGLASCFSIVEQHGGTIEVESEEGIGSTFSVYLPVK
jgi:signal transduction histidine kinase